MDDRFAGGHQFDKQQMIDEAHLDIEGNRRARVIHNEHNDTGVEVTNADGETWMALGDSQWAHPDNEENRVRTAETVLGSYGDIDAIMSGEKTVDDFGADKAATAHATAPVWSDEKNQADMDAAKELTTKELIDANMEDADVAPLMLERAWKKLGFWAEDHHLDDPSVVVGPLQASPSAVDAIANGANAAWNSVKGAVSGDGLKAAGIGEPLTAPTWTQAPTTTEHAWDSVTSVASSATTSVSVW